MNRTKVDWLAGRTKQAPDDVLATLRPAFGPEGEMLHFEARKRGWMGYEASADICLANMCIGMAAWGGHQQRGWSHVSLTGKGCDWVRDWDVAQERLHSLGDWDARRVDLALDTFKGEASHEDVLAAYRLGQFSGGGRPPKMTQILPEDPDDGRTIYIGKRTSDKFIRAYEKGREMARGTGITAIDGVSVKDWYRVELELKAKDRPLPEDLIDRRDQYMAGSYPYLQKLLCDVEPEILVSLREKAPQMDLAAQLEKVRTQYGRLIFTATVAYHGDIGAVMEKITQKEHHQELLRAGVLLVDH